MVASRSLDADLTGDIGDLDYCSPPLPGILDDGSLSPELAAFPARVLSEDFEFLDLRFGMNCREEGKVLNTRWRYKANGQEVWVSQSEGETPVARISEFYTAFSDGGFDFNISIFQDGQNALPKDEQAKLIQQAMLELGNHRPLECFYRNDPMDWADLAKLGIGDPRPELPGSLSIVRLEFSVLLPPDDDCPPLPRTDNEPELQFTAMLGGAGNDLLSLHIRSKFADEAPSKFEPGTANWSNQEYAFSIIWHPELHSDEEIRRIADALDPGFDSVCKLESTEATADSLAAWGVNTPVFPVTARKGLDSQIVSIKGSPGCSPAATGFTAHWMMESTDPIGILEVVARNGPQTQPWLTYYGADSSIYWKRTDGTEFVVSGIKAHFERSILLSIAASLDPGFNESQLTSPPAP